MQRGIFLFNLSQSAYLQNAEVSSPFALPFDVQDVATCIWQCCIAKGWLLYGALL